MKSLVVTVLIFFFMLNTFSFAQEQNLAKIGNFGLSAKEFKQRFELTPKTKSDFDSTKVNFLFSKNPQEITSLVG